jgi:transposase-like protein
MGRKPRVDRSPEEKWQIVQEGIKSGNVSETCRRYGIAPNLLYRAGGSALISPRTNPFDTQSESESYHTTIRAHPAS